MGERSNALTRRSRAQTTPARATSTFAVYNSGEQTILTGAEDPFAEKCGGGRSGSVRDGRRRERERAHNGYGEGYVAGEEKRLSRSRRAWEVEKAQSGRGSEKAQ